MNYQVFRLLEREELERVVSYISQQNFVDGKISARGLAGEVKHNLQIARTVPEPGEADNILLAALQRNRDPSAIRVSQALHATHGLAGAVALTRRRRKRSWPACYCDSL